MAFPLGRIYRPDPRDRDYLMERRLPDSAVTPTGRRLWDYPVVMDQGNVPACTGYGSSGALAAQFYGAPDKAQIVFDALGLYQWANANDGDPTPHDGSTVRAALSGLVKIGDRVVSSTDPTETAGTMEQIQGYLWANTSRGDADTARIAQWILTISPVVIGIPWTDAMFCEDPNTGSFVAPPGGYIHPTGPVAGGHCVYLRGVATDVPGWAFVLRNSWGPTWGITITDNWGVHLGPSGVGGDVLVSRASLERLLTMDGSGEAGALTDSFAAGP